ncbi:MAG: hypoxanthine phosphoribosyltransferase [Dysgonamonadaceae bacterium]|nr:hypoxanthine phosphoribosyltransferase [Dysgonamonadaceae bacterium]
MTSVQIKDKHFELFIREEIIIDKITRIAERINSDMTGKTPLFICVLNGVFMFAADLFKRIEIPCEITFVRLKSYQGAQTSGTVREIHGLTESIENRNVIILEDIIDTGFTMRYLIDKLQIHKPASMKIATLLFKPNALQTDITPDYAAIEIPNDFIVGYGLDYDGFGRNLRNIYKIKLC